MATGKLYIVATPIGNFGDITFRAIETLKSVDLVLCEDTRMTRRLLDHYEITKPTRSYHQHSTGRDVKEIVVLLEQGQNIALVTDAGTPGISDPGNLLIRSVILSGAKIDSGAVSIIPIPGPSAVISALSISGFATDKFVFMGFPPHKNKRQKYFKEVVLQKNTVAFYESGHRIAKCLSELSQLIESNRQIMVARELTKMFETIYRGTIAEILTQKIDERGEFVVVVESN